MRLKTRKLTYFPCPRRKVEASKTCTLERSRLWSWTAWVGVLAPQGRHPPLGTVLGLGAPGDSSKSPESLWAGQV